MHRVQYGCIMRSILHTLDCCHFSDTFFVNFVIYTSSTEVCNCVCVFVKQLSNVWSTLVVVFAEWPSHQPVIQVSMQPVSVLRLQL